MQYDPSQPNAARMYDYYLGGKDNGPVDRAAAEAAIAEEPLIPLMARENRAFLRRVVRHLAGRGIRQFVDIGSGLPTQANTHEIAQEIAPEARIVYVDNDPLVLAHGRALLVTNARTTIIKADLREPDAIIGHPELKELIDWSQPTAVLMIAALHFIRDSDDPYGIVAKLRSVVAPGSFLALSHGERTRKMKRAAKAAYSKANAPGVPRPRKAIERFFTGFELQDPGLVPVTQWRPDLVPRNRVIPFLGGVGLKPVEASHG
ncbi:SAM-dependent methyltransferase [Actinoallomurus vinaceus]|uniref:SAM-dependent methyltransferase n=1 Tax=Actinoallomurus vinaceus TaxID=1080074 RepID=A0ABP8UDR8_9ACTN